MDNIETKKAFEDLNKAFEEFKQANDQKLAEVEKKGTADAVVTEKVAKINSAITDLQEKMDKRIADVETAIRRPGATGDEGAKNEDQIAHKAAFNAFIRKGVDAGLADIERKALSVNSDPDGGYLVTPEMAGIITTRVFETSDMRQVANVMTISTDSVDLIDDYDEASGGWTSETGAVSTTDTPQLGKLNIPVHELYAQPKATQKQLDDAAVDVEGWLATKIADILGRTENAAFISGDGNGKPRGILSYGAWSVAGTYERNALEEIASGASGAVAADSIISLIYALKDSYRRNAAFMMARSTREDIRLLKQDNKYLWQPGLQAGEPDTLAGYRIVSAEDMPAPGASAECIAFGDFRAGYLIVDRLGIRTLRDPYTEKPFVKFYTTKRVGGAVTNFEAIKIYKCGA